MIMRMNQIYKRIMQNGNTEDNYNISCNEKNKNSEKNTEISEEGESYKKDNS